MPSLLRQPLRRQLTRAARCYHCGVTSTFSAHALSASCPACAKRIALADVVLRRTHWAGPIATAGSVLIHRGAHVRAKRVTACGSITVLGALYAHVASADHVRVGPDAILEGPCAAPRLIIEPGATLLGGPFRVPACELPEPAQGLTPDQADSPTDSQSGSQSGNHSGNRAGNRSGDLVPAA